MLKQLIPFWNYFKETSLAEDYLRKLCGKYVGRSWLRTAANFRMCGFKSLNLKITSNLFVPQVYFTWEAKGDDERIWTSSRGFSSAERALIDACDFLKNWEKGAVGTGN